MLPSERKQRILSVLREKREVSVQVLSDLLETPAANVRRDLRELETENRIERRHGRAIYRSSLMAAPELDPAEVDPAALDDLVDETAFILGEARNLFLTGGAVLARAVKKLRGKTIVTHDLALALAAAGADNDVSLLGKEVDNRTLTVRSASSEADLREHWFDAAVFEVDGVDEKNLWVARKNHPFALALLARSDSFVAVASSRILGRKGDRVLGPLTRADVLLIDKGLSDEARRALVDAGLEVRVAGEGGGGPLALDRIGNVFVFKRVDGRFGGERKGPPARPD